MKSDHSYKYQPVSPVDLDHLFAIQVLLSPYVVRSHAPLITLQDFSGRLSVVLNLKSFWAFLSSFPPDKGISHRTTVEGSQPPNLPEG